MNLSDSETLDSSLFKVLDKPLLDLKENPFNSLNYLTLVSVLMKYLDGKTKTEMITMILLFVET